MLTHLKASNIALIEKVELDLGPHLNIFSGETGAGKSMLIDSIQFAIGNRTSKHIIRKGEDCATVELVFTDRTGLGLKYLKDNQIPCEGDFIIIERLLYQSGRTLYKINHTMATRQIVKELSSFLIDVHGQHEPQSLLDVSKHIKMLDSFGAEPFSLKRAAYKKLYERWQNAKKSLEKIGDNDRKRLQLKDMFTFQINEITSAKLIVDEEATLKEQYQVLSHAEKIMLQYQRAYDALDGENELSGAALLGKAIQAIQDISGLSTEINALYEQLLAIEANLQDATYQIRTYTESIDYSPEALVEVQSRLDIIYRLKQKYGSSVQDILQYKVDCEKELKELLDGEYSKEKLLIEIIEIESQLNSLAEEISQDRKATAEKIEKEIDAHLHDLQMPYAKFEVAINDLDTFNSLGKNDVEFLIRTNLGDDMHPLSKIASGGEISRVMLAIKVVLVLGDTIDTVIFDEIDSGISGTAAQKVAEKLGVISRDRQVICITHLPQIAAMGDKHYLIEKEIANQKTITNLKQLDDVKMCEELSRLMGGIITQNTMQSAKEIKALANKYKKGIGL